MTKSFKWVQRFLVYLPTTHSKIRNCIVVRLENFGVIEDFISKGVQTIEGHSNICSCHPFLEEIEMPSDKTSNTLLTVLCHWAVGLTKPISMFLPHCSLCTSEAHMSCPRGLTTYPLGFGLFFQVLLLSGYSFPCFCTCRLLSPGKQWVTSPARSSVEAIKQSC